MSIFTLTTREELTGRVWDAITRMQAAQDPGAKLLWARRANAARRERGDFDHLVEAKREKLDQAGERHD